jgi:AbrB family looped-hinge helix DNA binding protein
MTENGRILIPAECRKLLGLRENEQLLLHVDEQGLHVTPLVHQLRAFRDKMKQDLKPGVKLLNDLRQMRSQDVE